MYAISLLFPLFLPFLTRGVYQGVSAILSIGGWSGSRFFSSAVATDANRTAFVKAILNQVGKYKLDGIEIECVSFDLSKSYLLIAP
jgi:Glycosyl hydrolases family 18